MATQQASRALLPGCMLTQRGRAPLSPGTSALVLAKGRGRMSRGWPAPDRGEGPLCRILSSGPLELGSDSPQPEAGSVAQPASSSAADEEEGGVAGPGYGDSSYCLFAYLSPRLTAQAESTPCQSRDTRGCIVLTGGWVPLGSWGRCDGLV